MRCGRRTSGRRRRQRVAIRALGAARAGAALALLLAHVPPVAAAAPPPPAHGSPAACAQVDYGTLARAPAARSPETLRVKPPNPAGPTLIGVGFWVLEIRAINPVQSDFHFRGIVRTVWCDPRLAFDPAQEGATERVYSGDQIDRELVAIWTPQAFPVNRAGGMDVTERIIRVTHDGTVSQDVNLNLHLGARYHLRRFPFDQQTLELQVESFVYGSDQVQLINDPRRTGFDDELDVPEWTIEGATGSVQDIAVLRSDRLFSHYVLAVEISRKPAFYLWKAFLPLLVIVALSWSVFWMLDETLAGRIRISVTIVLTTVAYQFIFSGDLPRVGYLTLLDKIMIGSFMLVSITVIESVLVDAYRQRDPATAIRIDRPSRWLFPLIYAVLLAAIFTVT